MTACRQTITGDHHFKDDEFYVAEAWRVFPVCIFCGLVDDREANVIDGKEPPKRDHY